MKAIILKTIILGLAGAVPASAADFTVYAGLPWQDSGVAVVSGGTYTITAYYWWTGGVGAYGKNGPTGAGFDWGWNQWVTGPYWSALVASIGDITDTTPGVGGFGTGTGAFVPVSPTLPNPVPALHPFLTGDSVTFTAGASGDLYFTINDDASGQDYGDNSGIMFVSVPETMTGIEGALGLLLPVGASALWMLRKRQAA